MCVYYERAVKPFEGENMSQQIVMDVEELERMIEGAVERAVKKYLGEVRVGGGRRVSVNRPYAGKQLCYFVVSLEEMLEAGMEDEVVRILDVLGDDGKFPQEQVIARCMRWYANETRRVVMWAPNQSYLIVGNNRLGERERGEDEKFRIPLEMMRELGSCLTSMEEVKGEIGLVEYVKREREESAVEEMAEKLRKMGGRG